MSGFTEVTLVDGVGRPRIHAVPDALVPPNVIAWGHPQRARNERQVIVHFDRTPLEVDPDGRTIYRQRGTGDPIVRFAYLTKSPITRLRLEDTNPGPACNGD